MGLFGQEVIRLLRETWASPTELADELYAILSSAGLEITGPVRITNPNGSGEPALTINDQGWQPASIVIHKQPLPPFPDFPPLPDIPPFTVGDIIIDETVPSTDGGGGGKKAGGGTSAFPCKVLSGGPGNAYLCAVYTSGTDGEPLKVTVTQLDIAGGETIPAGTWAWAFVVQNKYYMQVPVWLDT